MHQVCVVLLCILPTIRAGLLEALTNDEKGLQLGNGVSLHLDRVIKANGSLLDTHALRLDYSGMGLSVGKALKSDAVQLKLFVTDEVEGRKRRKVGDIMVPALIGFKMTAIAAAVFTAVTVLVLKSVALGNLSIAVALGIFLSKYFGKKSENKEESIYYTDPTYHSYPSATGI
ncbi:hypothetical protein RI129_006107 [Pyrocoelia pectoralis]|uniref:Uncharacterized protein n=1 Tax=Pyrocoelia pectoralis TaxID=417401 RepID=A0AAN7ZI18_9COLE